MAHAWSHHGSWAAALGIVLTGCCGAGPGRSTPISSEALEARATELRAAYRFTIVPVSPFVVVGAGPPEEVRGYAAPIKLSRKLCDLGDIWRETWSHLEVTRKDQPVSLHESVEASDLGCRVDAHAIAQVFRNILENAIAACREPGEIVIHCAETVLNGAPALRVAVRDNGSGLDDEQKARIFDPFFTTKTQGTGLGMAIALRIVESHGGRIEVGDSADSGAEILVTLPRAAP